MGKGAGVAGPAMAAWATRPHWKKWDPGTRGTFKTLRFGANFNGLAANPGLGPAGGQGFGYAAYSASKALPSHKPLEAPSEAPCTPT